MENSSILIVDDTKANIDILLRLLSDYDVLVALNGESAIEIAKQESVDLILLDIVMPGLDGFETCQALKALANCADTPIVFITAKTDEDSIEKAYEVGGLDYVTKPFKPRELLARVKTQLSLKYMIADLAYLSSYDTMTQVYNRRMFFELGMQQYDTVASSFYAVMLDIDHFKNINDSYGHATGDIVIKKVAAVMKQALPENSVIGRLGGEEFAILVWQLTTSEVQALVEAIRLSIQLCHMHSDTGEQIQVTISGGIALKTSVTTDLDELLKQADDALYQAKNSGRNTITLIG